MEEAATRGTETETDALLILMIVENREGRPEGALERLAYMQQRHPGNRLLWLNRGATALAAHRPQEADQVLTDGIVRHDLVEHARQPRAVELKQKLAHQWGRLPDDSL
jgi:hypothetical protein